MRLTLKTIGIIPLFLSLSLSLTCGLTWQQASLRLSWLETTGHKFLLYDGPVIELFQKRTLTQSFRANYPGLAQIDILFKGGGGGRQKVIFRLKSSCAAENDIVYLSTELADLDTLTFYPFKFRPLDDSAGRHYCIVLQAPEATKESAVQLQLSDGDLYPAGELQLYDPVVEPGKEEAIIPASIVNSSDDLPYKIRLPIIFGRQEKSSYINDSGFQLHYIGSFMPTVQVFIARLTANKPYLLGQSWFYGILSIVYIILLVGLFYLARKAIQLDR